MSAGAHELNAGGIAFFETGERDNPTLVLGHALGADHRIWDRVVDLLSDFHVVTWDLPGHGGSALLEEPYTMDHVASLVLDGLQELGMSDFHVGGISLGGMASLKMAATPGVAVKSLAVLDAGPVLLPSSAWHARAAQVRASGMASIVDETMARWFTEDFYLGAGKEECAAIRRRYLECDPEGFARCCEVIAHTDLRPEVASIAAKTLLLTGDQDAGMSPQALGELAASMTNAQVIQVVAPEAKHLTCVQRPDLVAKALTNLVRGA